MFDPGAANEWLKLATAVAVLLLGWWRWGRKWWSAKRAPHREYVAGLRAMVAYHPQVVEYLSGAKERDDKAAADKTRLTAELKAVGDHLSRQDTKLDRIVAQQWARDRLDPVAKFQCDNEGRNESVNLAYAQELRVSEKDLLRFGWKLRIAAADLREYERDVAQAFREHRRYEGTVRMVRGDETCFRAHVRIEPHPEDPADLTGGGKPTWFGAILVVEELS